MGPGGRAWSAGRGGQAAGDALSVLTKESSGRWHVLGENSKAHRKDSHHQETVLDLLGWKYIDEMMPVIASPMSGFSE